MQANRIQPFVLQAALLLVQPFAVNAVQAGNGPVTIIGEEGRQTRPVDCPRAQKSPKRDCLQHTEYLVMKTPVVPMPPMASTTSPSPAEQALRSVDIPAPHAAKVPTSKANMIAAALGKPQEQISMAEPVRLSVGQLAVAGVAYLSSFGADVNSQLGALALSGREHERLVVRYKPWRTNGPVLVTLGVRQEGGAGRTPPSIIVSGPGVTQSAELDSPTMTINAVVVSRGADWQQIQISVPRASFAMLDYVELTPIR
jgi:hypothetical protein